MRATNRLALLATLAAAAALGGCGGGDEAAGPAAPLQAQRVDITQANANAVAAQSVDAASADFFGDAVGVTGVQIDAPAVRAASVIAAIGDTLRRLRNLRGSAPLLVGVTATETEPCTNGGTVVITVDVAVEGELNAGDLATLDFDACREAVATLDGRLALRIVALATDFSQLTADATATSLTARVGAIGQRADGTIRVAVDESLVSKSVLRLSSDAFTLRRLVGSTVRATRMLLDFDYRLETATANGQTTETFEYVASGTFPRLGDVSFAVATTAPVVTPGNATHPTSGAATVTGRNGTTLDLTVVPTGIALELDRGGDGTVEFTGLLTWAGLESEL